LEKIIFNYLSNALKYTKAGGTIMIMVEEEGEQVKVSVVDSGVGISKDDQKKLFKVFSQVDNSTSREFEGTGLGLALVKELAKSMNAEVGVKSDELEFGTKFWVKFNIASDKELNVLDALFIDDDDEQVVLFRNYMERELPFMNYKAVHNTKEARAILEHNNVKCILSDAVMPIEDGVSFLTWVSGEYPKTTKVLVTGNINTQMLEKSINESQIDHVIQKPWQTSDFKEKIVAFVKASKLKVSIPSDLKKFTPKDWLVEQDSQDQSIDSQPTEEFAEGSGELILVVDDLKDMRSMISTLLKKNSYNVHTAINGVDALEKIKRKKPDLIVTDWMMPKMSGVELINKIKSDEKLAGIPTVLLTAKSDEESKSIGIEIGADGYVGKPFSEIELISVVTNNLRLKKREREVEVLNDNISQNILKRYIPQEKIDEMRNGKDIFSQPSETKGLTILSLDISNFDLIVDELSVKKAATILNDYLVLVSEITDKHGGIISKIDRSSVTAIFGYNSQIPQHENINSAILSIENIYKNVLEMNDKHNLANVKVSLRSALHAGTVQVGFFGGAERSEFMAIGKPIEKINKARTKLKSGDIVYTKEILSFMENQHWETNREKVTLDGFPQDESFFKVIMN
jgi:response regulator RpfG family c-di-GMP phosphodiesterase